MLIELGLEASDLERVLLTSFFGGQIDVDAILVLGMISPVRREVVENITNGAGFGAAMFLSDERFALGKRLAARAEQIDPDLDPGFNQRYVESLGLSPVSGIG